MSEELKPCPFCGGDASRQDLTDADNAGGSCIACDRCGASSPVHFDRKENLYDSWNRRASPTPPTTEGRDGVVSRLQAEAAYARERGHHGRAMLLELAKAEIEYLRSLSPPSGDGKQEQARPSGSAPISTLSKDTTK